LRDPGSSPQQGDSQKRMRDTFTMAATAVTRLYWQQDHGKFVAAANAVTSMHRAAEAEVVRAQARG